MTYPLCIIYGHNTPPDDRTKKKNVKLPIEDLTTELELTSVRWERERKHKKIKLWTRVVFYVHADQHELRDKLQCRRRDLTA